MGALKLDEADTCRKDQDGDPLLAGENAVHQIDRAYRGRRNLRVASQSWNTPRFEGKLLRGHLPPSAGMPVETMCHRVYHSRRFAH